MNSSRKISIFNLIVKTDMEIHGAWQTSLSRTYLDVMYILSTRLRWVFIYFSLSVSSLACFFLSHSLIMAHEITILWDFIFHTVKPIKTNRPETVIDVMLTFLIKKKFRSRSNYLLGFIRLESHIYRKVLRKSQSM